MIEECIAEVGIDHAGRLFVRPAAQSFPFIYRAAMQIEWDVVSKRLYSPAPTDGSHFQWFEQIRRAAAEEYGVDLRPVVTTQWSNLPELLRSQIEAVASSST